MINHRMNFALRLFLSGVFVASSCCAEEYKVQFQRKAAAGQRFFLTAQSQNTHKTSAAFLGRTSPEQKVEFVTEVAALVKVLETDAVGSITKATCTISNCFKVEGKYRHELLPSQTVVMASVEGGKPQFTIKGKPAEGDTLLALAATIELKTAGPTNSEILGTDSPRKIGESWSVKPEPMVAMFQAQRLVTTKEDIQGKSTLEKLVKVGGVDCLELSSKVYLKKFAPPLPPSAQIKLAFGAFRYSGKYPLDVSLNPLEESMEFTYDFVAQTTAGTNAVSVTTKASVLVKRNIQRSYLK